jgi:heme/copper-type cytochrome/quinol oxidase subunit 3
MGQAHSLPPRTGPPRRGLRLVRAADPPSADRRPVRRSPAVLGMSFFLGSEAVLFATLIAAYLTLRAGAEAWPPPGQPRLPVLLTGFNTGLLLLSAATMWQALRAIRMAHLAACRRWLAVTLGLGAVFLLIQGSEWVRLIGFGLRVSSGTYGGMFYALIGMHALHVLVAVVVLGLVLWRAHGRPYGRARHVDVTVGSLYWLFVVAVWPLLYVLVYLV